MHAVGRAFYVLALTASLCQAAVTPLVGGANGVNLISATDSARVHSRGNPQTPAGLDPATRVPVSLPNLGSISSGVGLLGSPGLAAPHETGTTNQARDVYSPPILYPNRDSVWQVGSNQIVKWDTRDPPKSITNRKGKIVLGYVDQDGKEHLFMESPPPLADDFDIMKGSAKVKVPDVPPGASYVIILFGDSGNISQQFKIV